MINKASKIKIPELTFGLRVVEHGLEGVDVCADGGVGVDDGLHQAGGHQRRPRHQVLAPRQHAHTVCCTPLGRQHGDTQGQPASVTISRQVLHQVTGVKGSTEVHPASVTISGQVLHQVTGVKTGDSDLSAQFRSDPTMTGVYTGASTLSEHLRLDPIHKMKGASTGESSLCAHLKSDLAPSDRGQHR